MERPAINVLWINSFGLVALLALSVAFFDRVKRNETAFIFLFASAVIELGHNVLASLPGADNIMMLIFYCFGLLSDGLFLLGIVLVGTLTIKKRDI